MRVFARCFCVALCVLLITPATKSQSIVVDLQGNSTNLVSWPTNLVKTQPVPFLLRNINGLMYTYGIAGSCTQNSASPWELLAPVISKLPLSPTAQNNPCVTASTKAIGDWNLFQGAFTTFIGLPASNTAGSNCTVAVPCRISLADAKAAWKPVQTVLVTAKDSIVAAQSQCQSNSTLLKQMDDLNSQELGIENWYKAATSWQGTATISPDSNCMFTINEMYGSTATAPTRTITFTAGQPRLTISAGPLFSELQDRSYSIVTAPPAQGSTTSQNILQVNGSSEFSPYLLGLLNYALPIHGEWSNGELAGVSLSTGPVVRVGSQSTASPFGWFAGGSYHLYHLIYVSVGAHIGQFSDFPVGFTAAGQTVPSDFSLSSARNRTSMRFAFAITFRAKDLSSLGKTSAQAKATTP